MPLRLKKTHIHLILLDMFFPTVKVGIIDAQDIKIVSKNKTLRSHEKASSKIIVENDRIYLQSYLDDSTFFESSVQILGPVN